MDPRFYLALFLVSFDLYALQAPYFNRTAAQFLAAVTTCVGLDALLLWGVKRLPLFPFSGLITSLGITLLCDSPYVWPYVFVGAVSILSKHLIRVDGRHVFNPNNFGIVVGVLFFCDFMVVEPGRWGNDLTGLAAVAGFGVLAAYKGRRLELSLAYAVSFLVGCYARSWWTEVSVTRFIAPMTGAAFMLFTFYMITDPMTTPETRRARVLYGISIGALDSLLRHLQVPFAPFHALLAHSAFVPVLRRALAWKFTPVWTIGLLSPSTILRTRLTGTSR